MKNAITIMILGAVALAVLSNDPKPTHSGTDHFAAMRQSAESHYKPTPADTDDIRLIDVRIPPQTPPVEMTANTVETAAEDLSGRVAILESEVADLKRTCGQQNKPANKTAVKSADCACGPDCPCRGQAQASSSLDSYRDIIASYSGQPWQGTGGYSTGDVLAINHGVSYADLSQMTESDRQRLLGALQTRSYNAPSAGNTRTYRTYSRGYSGSGGCAGGYCGNPAYSVFGWHW